MSTYGAGTYGSGTYGDPSPGGGGPQTVQQALTVNVTGNAGWQPMLLTSPTQQTSPTLLTGGGGGITKQANVPRTITVGKAVTLRYLPQKLFTVTVGTTVTMVVGRLIVRTLSATAPGVVSFVRRAAKTIQASQAVAVNDARSGRKSFSIPVLVTPTFPRRTNVQWTLFRTVTPTFVITQTLRRTISVVVSAPAVQVVKRISKSFSTTVGSTRTFNFHVTKPLALTVGTATTLSRRVASTLSVTVGRAVTIGKAISFRLVTTSFVTTALSKAQARVLQVAVNSTPTVVKQISTRFTASATTTVSFLRSLPVRLTVTVPTAVSFARRISFNITRPVTTSVSFNRFSQFFRTFGVGATGIPSVHRGVRKRLDLGGAADPYASVIAATPGVLSHWRLGENGPFQDSVGTAHETARSGTISQAPALIADANGAAYFSGNASVAFGDAYDFAGTAPFTVEAWIRPDALPVGAYRRVVSTEYATNRGWQFTVNHDATAGYRIALYRHADDGTQQAQGTASNTLVVGGVHHVVATYDGSIIRIYINGAIKGTSGAASVPLTASATGLLRIGAQGNGNFAQFAGAIDEVAIYDRALDAAVVADHYNAGEAGVITTASFQRLTNKTVAQLVTAAATMTAERLSQAFQQILTASVSVVASRSAQVGKAFNVDSAVLPTLVKRAAVVLTRPTLATPIFRAHIAKGLSVIQPVSTPAIRMAVSKAFGVTVGAVITIPRLVRATRSVTVNTARTIAKRVNKVAQATITTTPTYTRRVALIRSVAVNASPTLNKALAWVLDLAVNPVATLTTAVVALERTIEHVMNVGVTGSANMARAMKLTFEQVIRADVPSVTQIRKEVSKTFESSADVAVNAARQVGKVASATVNDAASMRRDARKVVDRTVVATPHLVRRVAHALSVGATASPSFVWGRMYARTLTVFEGVAPSITRQVSFRINYAVATTPTVVKRVAKVVTRPITTAATIYRQVGKVLRANEQALPDLTTNRTLLRTLTTTATASVFFTRARTKELVAYVTTQARFGRDYALTLTAEALVQPVITLLSRVVTTTVERAKRTRAKGRVTPRASGQAQTRRARGGLSGSRSGSGPGHRRARS